MQCVLIKYWCPMMIIAVICPNGTKTCPDTIVLKGDSIEGVGLQHFSNSQIYQDIHFELSVESSKLSSNNEFACWKNKIQMREGQKVKNILKWPNFDGQNIQ